MMGYGGFIDAEIFFSAILYHRPDKYSAVNILLRCYIHLAESRVRCLPPLNVISTYYSLAPLLSSKIENVSSNLKQLK